VGNGQQNKAICFSIKIIYVASLLALTQALRLNAKKILKKKRG